MAAERKTTARHEVVATDYGLWCKACRLPSGLRVFVAVWVATKMRLETHLICDDCNGRDVAPED